MPSASDARKIAEQALVSCLLQDVLNVGPAAVQAGVQVSDIDDIWFQQMYGVLVEDGMWRDPMVIHAGPEERIDVVRQLAWGKLRTRMYALARTALAERVAAEYASDLANHQANAAYEEAKEAVYDAAWWAKEEPDSPRMHQARAWEAEVYARAVMYAGEAERAAQRRNTAVEKHTLLLHTITSRQAWSSARDLMQSLAVSPLAADTRHSAVYMCQVIEHGISARARAIGEELDLQLHDLAGVSAPQMLTHLRAAIDALGVEQIRTGDMKALVPTPVQAQVKEASRWNAPRIEDEVLISLVAFSEQLTNSNAAGLRPEDMSRPERAHLLTALIEQVRDGLAMDPHQLTQRALQSAERKGEEVDVGYFLNILDRALNPHHTGRYPGGSPSREQLARLAHEKTPGLIMLSVRRHVTTIVVQSREQLKGGASPRTVVAGMRSNLAYAAEQVHRHPYALGGPGASQGPAR
ncbi:hypothetical protein [Streptomyces rhizosphaericus]|uniref:hypothetical protein n=1 Tax=Streptomyces rhizosphaericus TaxID=114699 RepID=UPI000A37CAB6|nr:hypothetical protein [Streptomyces rhizosphaericus]